MLLFLATLVDFVDKKKNKLRVRSDLKLNKDQVLPLIFGDIKDKISFDANLQYYLAVLMDFYFSKHEIYDHIENMEENYAKMYDEYLMNYDLSNN